MDAEVWRGEESKPLRRRVQLGSGLGGGREEAAWSRFLPKLVSWGLGACAGAGVPRAGCQNCFVC